MKKRLSGEEIRAIRNLYGLSQKSFALVLGIGEASMCRYENGVVPSAANANLIWAARNPRFMLDCLESEEIEIPVAQRHRAESFIYEHINLGGETPLLEKPVPGIPAISQGEFKSRCRKSKDMAAQLVLCLMQHMVSQGTSSDDSENVLVQLLVHLSKLKQELSGEELQSMEKLIRLEGHIAYIGKYLNDLIGASPAA